MEHFLQRKSIKKSRRLKYFLVPHINEEQIRQFNEEREFKMTDVRLYNHQWVG